MRTTTLFIWVYYIHYNIFPNLCQKNFDKFTHFFHMFALFLPPGFSMKNIQRVHGTMHFFNAYMVPSFYFNAYMVPCIFSTRTWYARFNALLRTKITAWQQVPSGLYVLIAYKNYSFSSTLRMRSPSLMSAGEMLCPARFACTKLFLYVRIR